MVRHRLSRTMAEPIVRSNGESVPGWFVQSPLLPSGIVVEREGCENRAKIELKMGVYRSRLEPQPLEALPVELRCSFLYGLVFCFVVRQPLAILGNIPTTAINPQVPIAADPDYSSISELGGLGFDYLKVRLTKLQGKKGRRPLLNLPSGASENRLKSDRDLFWQNGNHSSKCSSIRQYW